MKRILSMICILVMTVGWMVLIYSLSAQSGDESGGLSALIAQPVTDAIAFLQGGLSADEKAALYTQVDGSIRIIAHFSEYAMLGILMTLFCRVIRMRSLWIPWLICTVFAVTDEWHQYYTPGRTSDPVDVLIDTAGVICGIILLCIMTNIWRKKHVHHS